jgi:4-deoxy-L-threo-5-hexosulose-uronate ketol-isomerase
MPNQPRISPRPSEVQRMSTDELRSAFLIDRIFDESKLTMTFTDLDRLAIGGVRPLSPVKLENDRETGSGFFLARRELGVVNVGGPGSVKVDGKEFPIANLDTLYVSMGSKDVVFSSTDQNKPAKFYFVSCPAHQAHPTTHIPKEKITPKEIGSQETANHRKIYQSMIPANVKTCQLVLGFTELLNGSVWNTMPAHTHTRRTEIYFYFDMGDNILSHFLGQPQATRHLFVHNDQATLSPNWSIHCGVGTASYKFIWAMAGENQLYDDMDAVAKLDLR